MVAASLAGSAAAQSVSVLYSPARTAKDQGLTLRGWGSGLISETDETAYEGANSLRVSTRNFFQGGTIRFAKPIDLNQEFGEKANLLRLTYKVADGGAVGSGAGPGRGGPGEGLSGPGRGGAPGRGAPGGTSGPGGRPGGGPGGRPGGAGPGGFPGGAPGGGFPGGAPGGFAGGPQGGLGSPGGGGQAATPAIKTLRAIVTTTDGKKSEAYVPVTSTAVNERGWATLAVPLQAITGLDRTNKQIQEIAFSADDTVTFYIGDLRVVSDTTPIRGETDIKGSLNIGATETRTFRAYGSGGASILRYTWDFDDADGIQVDAEGQTVRRRFRKPGTYTITLTVSDYFGLKEPYKTTLKVTVNP
jgi:hypothetical protein